MADSPSLNGSGVIKLTVFSGGTQISDAYPLISIELNNAVNKIPMAKIVLVDGDMPNDAFPVSDSEDFKPGAEIKINAGYGDEEVTIFEGIVIKHGIKISGNNNSRLIVECRDKAVAMTVGRKNANYVDNKDSTIISKLIGNYGALTADVGTTETEYKELVQYHCSDWDFMLARAEANGLITVVDAGKVSVKAPQTDAAAVLTVTYGIDLIEFQSEMDARNQFSSVNGTTWDLASQAVIEQQATPPTLNAQGDITAATLAGVLGLSSYRLQTAAPLESTALKAWADAQQLKAGLARIRGRMKFQGSSLAKTGCLIELKGVGNRFNGNIFVTAVNHDIRDGDWTTEVEFGLAPSRFSEQHNLAEPLAAGLTSGVVGLQIGVVLKLDADPEGQCKVQVSVPVLQAETSGVWARLSNFYSSEGIGAFFIPEIGDEVILGYVNGDPSHPVILGSLYSSKRAGPYTMTADNFIKAIVTKSKLKLEFDDDKKIITVITPGANKIIISDDGKSILLQDQNGNKIEMNADGIVIDSPKDIKISAKGKITLDAVGNIEATAKADIKNQALNINNNANVGFVAKGAATAELSASGQTTVKGAMVMIN